MIGFNSNRIIGNLYLNHAMQMEKVENWDMMLKYSHLSLEKNACDKDAKSAVGLGYARTGEPGKAAEILKQVVLEYPYHLNALIKLATAYKALEKKDHALEIVNRILEIKPDCLPALLDAGMLNAQKKKYDAAIFLFRKAAWIDPKNPEIRCDIGALFLKKNMVTQAANEYEKALALAPEFPVAHKNLAILYYTKLNQAETAIDHMKTDIRIRPDTPVSREFEKILLKKFPE